MWSKGIINVTRLKCLLIILGLRLPRALGQNAEPGESGKRDELGRVILGRGYNESSLTTNPIGPVSPTTQTTNQPFNWETIPKGEGALDERKDLLGRNAAAEPEVMPRAMSNKDAKEGFSTLASTSDGEKSRQSIGTGVPLAQVSFGTELMPLARLSAKPDAAKYRGTYSSPSCVPYLQTVTATLPTITRRKSRGKGADRRRRLKQFLAVMSHGKESNATTSELEASSGLDIGGEVNAELNSVQRPKKDRLNTRRGRVSSRRKPNRSKSGRDKELKESREQRKKLRLERRRRRNRERKRRNRSRKIRRQKQPHNQPAALFLAMPGVNPEFNATKLAEENLRSDGGFKEQDVHGSDAKFRNASRVRELELLRKYVTVNQQHDEPLNPESDHRETLRNVQTQEKNTSSTRGSFQSHRDHKDNVEKEFSKQLERELSKSKGIEKEGLSTSGAQDWSKFTNPSASVPSKFAEIASAGLSSGLNEDGGKSLDENSDNPRFAGEKMLGYSELENDLPSDDADNEVLSRNLKYYHDYITNSLRFPISQLHPMYSLSEFRRNSFPENSNISGLMAADYPNLLKQEQHPFGNITKNNSVSNKRNSAELSDTSAKSSRSNSEQIGTEMPAARTMVVDNLKGDLSCMNGTFIPAPLARHALIKYVKSSTPGNEYLEADYECTPGYYMATPARRLLCNNRRWVGDMPKCKLRQNPNDACADSPCEQVCRDVNGNPMCACYKGFRQEGVKCIDINECEKGNGGCEFTCLNTPGSYRCDCPKGMRQGENKYSCMDINECLLNNGHGPCQDTCENLEGGYRCSCEGLPGTILAGNNHTCQDAGPCGTRNAGCSHTCLSTMGRVFCLCPDGFMLEDDWKTCQDVDECAVPDLQSIVCQHGCINTPGSYRCAEPPEMRDEPPSNLVSKPCDPGFEPSVNGGCIDIDECSIYNGGCLEVCENTIGSYFCACNGDERLLAADGRTCVDINDVACPALNPSGRGYVMCSRLTTPKPWRGRKRVINRPGTKCFLRCPSGYQLRGEYELTCGTNGVWFGSKHGECVRYSKPRLDCPPDLIAEVPPGQSEAFVTFAQPSTDLDWFRYVRSEPSWGTRLEANLTPGEHKVTFIAKHPVSKKQAACTLHITVKPGEAPRIKNCPDNILAFGNNRTVVTWTEPIFTDNVKITNIISNKNPGHLFPAGEHKIHYEASDEAGWTATCEFLVTVRGD